MIKNALKLEFGEHTLTIPGGTRPTDFIIKPIGDNTSELLRTLHNFGCEINLTPNEEEPSSIFVRYNKSTPPHEVYGHSVVGVDMNLHLSLLGPYDNFDNRLERFLTDVKRHWEHELPKNHTSLDVRYVRVIRTYKY